VTGYCVPIFREIIRQFRKPRGNGPSQQLAQKSFCRNHDGVFGEKAVDRFILQAHDRLKSMHVLRLGLEAPESRRENRVAHLHLNKKPVEKWRQNGARLPCPHFLHLLRALPGFEWVIPICCGLRFFTP